MPWIPVPRLGIEIETCHQFFSRLPIERVHGPAAQVLKVLAPVVSAWFKSVTPFVTEGGKPKLATSCARLVLDCGSRDVEWVLSVPS